MYKIMEYYNFFKNKLFLFQIIILLISISYSLNNNCRNYEIETGNIYITEITKSNWQFLKPIKYNFEKLSEISKIKYHEITTHSYDNNIVFKGRIVLLDDEENKYVDKYVATFKEFLLHGYYIMFKRDFKKEVKINDISYNIELKEGYLFLEFLTNCKNNSILFEKDNQCFIHDNIHKNIELYLNDFFKDKLLLPNRCYNDQYFIEFFIKIIYFIINIILVFLFFNILLFFLLYVIFYFKNFFKRYNEEYIPLN